MTEEEFRTGAEDPKKRKQRTLIELQFAINNYAQAHDIKLIEIWLKTTQTHDIKIEVII